MFLRFRAPHVLLLLDVALPLPAAASRVLLQVIPFF